MALPGIRCIITLYVMILSTTMIEESSYASAFVATRTKNIAKCNSNNNNNNNHNNNSSNSAIRRIRGILQQQQQQQQQRESCLYTSKLDDDINNDEPNNKEEETATQSTTTTTVQFGDVAPLKRPSSSPSSSSTTATAAPQFGDVAPLKRSASSETTTAAATAQFGEVMSLKNKPSTTAAAVPAVPQEDNYEERIQQRRTNNLIVAAISILLALGNYSYQWTHPKTPIQLLVRMERASSPVSIIGTNNKPTVVDFWAPWCEQCRYMAPTLYQIEESYKDQVNFVSINGDDPQAWSMIEAFGVDAIPHLALVEYDGTVDTALIGPIQKHVLSEDLETLIANSVVSSTTQTGNTAEKQPLPHQMLDVFANKPPEQRIVHFEAAVVTEGTDAK